MTTPSLSVDIAIIGGGIAGLWALNQLRNQGYSAVLFEQQALGSNQTIASQGMIHGGIKYALGGALNSGSEAISEMPALWRSCLRGEGPVDLRECRVLSENFYLWSNASLQSRVSSFFASKMLRGRVEKLERPDYPEPLSSKQFKGQVYRLADLVLDVPSLVKTLAEQHSEAIFSIDWEHCQLSCDNAQAYLQWKGLKLEPKKLLLTAGAGNEALIQQLGAGSPAMQRRPLQQVLVKHEYPGPFYAHCSGANPSPRLTVSSHTTQAGEPLWYLGGDLATNNSDTPSEELILQAQRELKELLPWLDLGHCEWRTLRLDRAEPRQSRLLKPDEAFLGPVAGVDNALVGWPTKLTLTPNLGSAIDRALLADGITPGATPELTQLNFLGRPALAATYWDTLFQ